MSCGTVPYSKEIECSSITSLVLSFGPTGTLAGNLSCFGRNNISKVLARWHDQARGAGVNKPSASSRSALEILFGRYRIPLEETTFTNPLDVRKRRQNKLLSQVNNKLGGICPPKLTQKYAHQSFSILFDYPGIILLGRGTRQFETTTATPPATTQRTCTQPCLACYPDDYDICFG